MPSNSRLRPHHRRDPRLLARPTEFLEPRLLLTIKPEEQLFIYMLNRARHDPVAYQQEQGLTVDLSYVTPQPPLAVNTDLLDSSRFHSDEMANNDYFGHQSQVTGDWPNKMARDQGYPLPVSFPDNNNYIESIAAGNVYSTAAIPLNALIVDAGVPSLGHRNHLLGIGEFYAANREIGVGHSLNLAAYYDNYWAVHITRRENPGMFLTGVVYNDINSNGRYDLNEGLSGVTITTTGLQTTTNAAGGWSILVPSAGSYPVTASGGAFSGSSTTQVTMSTANREVDFISGRAGGIVDFSVNNTAPASLALNGTLVRENSPVGTQVGTLSTTDPDVGDAFIYTLVSGAGDTDNATFQISGNSLRTLGAVDYERKTSYTVRVRTTDQGGLFVENSFTLTVGNQNDTPAGLLVGSFRSGSFFLDATGNRYWDGTIGGDAQFGFGATTDLPLVGDWNGDGKSEVGAFRNGYFYLDANSNRVWNGPAAGDAQFSFGTAGDIPLVGDWNGDGNDDVGVFRRSQFYLDANGNRRWDGVAGGDVLFSFGSATDLPIIGDWNGDGRSDVGIYRNSYFYLDLNGNRLWNGTTAGDALFVFGTAGDIPIAGDWNGNGTSKVGVFRRGVYYLDQNGDRRWNGTTAGDVQFAFGSTTDTPLIGYWNSTPPAPAPAMNSYGNSLANLSSTQIGPKNSSSRPPLESLLKSNSPAPSPGKKSKGISLPAESLDHLFASESTLLS